MQWRLRENGFVEGTIELSIDPQYRDGDHYILNGTLVHYPFVNGVWPDHFILSTNTGKHFYLAAKEQTIDETPVA